MATGFVQVGLQLGLDALLIKPRRGIADLPVAQATIEELHTDELEITEQPVETGAAITDHAYKKPARVRITMGYSNSPGSSTLLGSLLGAVTGTLGGVASLLTGNAVSQVISVYQKFLDLQVARAPCDVYTGKRVYRNMLVRSVMESTNKETENSMVLVVEMQQIIIVPTATNLVVGAPASDQASPDVTQATDDAGTQRLMEAPTYNYDAGELSLANDVF